MAVFNTWSTGRGTFPKKDLGCHVWRLPVRGGGGTVTDPPATCTEPATQTRPQSPEYWAPEPAFNHQHTLRAHSPSSSSAVINVTDRVLALRIFHALLHSFDTVHPRRTRGLWTGIGCRRLDHHLARYPLYSLHLWTQNPSCMVIVFTPLKYLLTCIYLVFVLGVPWHLDTWLWLDINYISKYFWQSQFLKCFHFSNNLLIFFFKMRPSLYLKWGDI